MKHVYLSTIVMTVVGLVCPVSGFAQAKDSSLPNTIIEVRVEGNRVLSESAVLADVKTRPGQPYSERIVRDDEQRLLRTQRYDNVVATKTQTDKGVIVTFTVAERPLIEAVIFEGNKVFRDSTLAAVLTFGSGAPIDRFSIESGLRAILSKYRAGGYHFAEVKLNQAALRDAGKVVYEIVEGPKVSIRKIRFRGNSAFGSGKLKGVISSKAKLWPVHPGTLDTETADRDVAELINFYRSEGFLDAQVDCRREFSADKKKVVLVFVIDEGPHYCIRKTVFSGNKVFDSDELRRGLKLLAGAYYNGLSLNRDLAGIRNSYGQIGYIEANVSVKTQYTDKPGLVDLVYTIDEGSQFRVGQIDIRGNDVTKMNVIRRQLRLEPGQLYNAVAAEESRNRLMETGLFENVTVTPYGDAPGVRNAVAEVTETKTGRFLIGAGVSSNAGLLGNISFTERNFDLFARPDRSGKRSFRGGGQTLSISAEPGTEFMRFHIDWREPYLFDKPYSLGTRAFVFTSGRESYDETRYGGVVSVGRRFENRWYGEVAGRVEGVRVSDLDDDAPGDVRDVEGTTALAGVKGTLVRDRTDSRWLPSAGDRFRVSYEQVMGDFTFGRADADYRIYYTVYTDAIDRKHIIAARAAAGAIFADAPVFERYYGGGLGSVRGFDFRGISPRQGPDDDPVGGDFKMFLGSEYSFPIIARNLRGVVFIDSGTVEKNIEIGDYRVSAGVGLRLHLPFFGPVPMSLDFGFPINKTDEDDTQLVSFSIGWVF
ncbi:MAG: outer membrane protein assembly factor BamA [Planctomycetota bacterium]|nr:outer membrane protein assembly factor BamA [Planctomycetota bacterium]